MTPASHYLKRELYALIQKDLSLFEFLQSGSLDGIWYWDLENPENEWMSRRFWTLLGYDPATKKHLASEWQHLIHPKDLQVALKNFEQHCEDPNHPYDQVVRYRHKDGSTVWIRCRGIAIRDKTGKPIRMLGAHTNLTQQKAVEERLRDSEANLKLLTEHSADVIYRIDIETERYTYVSPSIEGIFGYTVEEALSLKAQDTLTVESYLRQRDRLIESMASKEMAPKIIELEALHKNGFTLPVEIHTNFICNEQGDPVEIMGVVRDISERRQTEKRTQKLNRLNQDLLLLGDLAEKLKRITDGVVDIFQADFARVWITKPGDRCDSGCLHAHVVDGPHVCKYRDLCLHLMSSSGRYRHIDGGHMRVPYGCYKIGRLASEEDAKFLTNDVVGDPRVHDHRWAQKLGLKSFAGYRLFSELGKCIGVLALFSKRTISSKIDALLEGLANTTSQVIQASQKEEALREREQLFRDLTESTSDWVWEVDRKGVYTYSSPKVKELLGYEPEEMIGKQPFDLMPADEAERVSTIFFTILASQQPFDSLENINIHQNGQPVVMESSGVPYFDADGKLLGYRGIDRDITNRKKAEEALRESDKRYRTLFETSIDALSILDVDTGEFIDCNKAAIGMHGIGSREKFVGLTPDKLSPEFQPDGGLSRELAMEHIQKAFHEGSSVFEWIHARPDGTTFPALVTLSAMPIGKRKLVLAVGRDLTAIKQAAEKKEQLIDELQEALSKVKVLSGLLPICASCKKIRDDQGYWNQIESYIESHTDASFSHGLCSECEEKLYGDQDWYKKNRGG